MKLTHDCTYYKLDLPTDDMDYLSQMIYCDPLVSAEVRPMPKNYY